MNISHWCDRCRQCQDKTTDGADYMLMLRPLFCWWLQVLQP